MSMPAPFDVKTDDNKKPSAAESNSDLFSKRNQGSTGPQTVVEALSDHEEYEKPNKVSIL